MVGVLLFSLCCRSLLYFCVFCFCSCWPPPYLLCLFDCQTIGYLVQSSLSASPPLKSSCLPFCNRVISVSGSLSKQQLLLLNQSVFTCGSVTLIQCALITCKVCKQNEADIKTKPNNEERNILKLPKIIFTDIWKRFYKTNMVGFTSHIRHPPHTTNATNNKPSNALIARKIRPTCSEHFLMWYKSL